MKFLLRLKIKRSIQTREADKYLREERMETILFNGMYNLLALTFSFINLLLWFLISINEILAVSILSPILLYDQSPHLRRLRTYVGNKLR